MGSLDRLLQSSRVASVVAVVGLALSIGGIFQSVVLAAALGTVVLFLVCELLLYRAFVARQAGRNYETISIDWEWDIDAQDGSHAFVRKTLKVKFLSDTRAIGEMVRGDGEPCMETLTCSPGKVVDLFTTADEHWAIISLRGVKMRGQQETFVLERESKEAFPNPEEEWVAIDTVALTQQATIKVVLPKGRTCEDAWVQQRSTRRLSHLDPSKDIQTNAGRTALTFRVVPPYRTEDRFTLRWRWASQQP